MAFDHAEPTKLLADLVALPSVNPMGRPLDPALHHESRVSDYLAAFFTRLGVPFERQTVAPGRDNVVARYASPGATRTLVLEAHQDTVPVDGMTIDPFGATIAEGKLFGRGACDIKGGMASMLSAFARVCRDKPASAMNVIMACTVDEEFTFLGVQELVKRGIRADFAVVAEPTRLNIVHAHKGVARVVLTVRGRACHSSRPQDGVSAIYRMARVLSALERLAAKLQTSAGDPLLGPPTISVGRIEGGVSVNTVPDECHIEIDRRIVPGEDPAATADEVLAFLRADPAIDFPVECPRPWMSMPALGAKGSETITALLGQSIDEVAGKHQVMPVPYGTDASTLARGGIPSVVFGPGDIAQAHTKDEWIEVEQLGLASEILYRLITRPA